MTYVCNTCLLYLCFSTVKLKRYEENYIICCNILYGDKHRTRTRVSFRTNRLAGF